MKSHVIEVRIGKRFEAGWHVVTYNVLAEDRQTARQLAGQMAHRWARSSNSRVKSGAVNVRS